MLKGPLTQLSHASRMQLLPRDYLSPKSGVSGESLVWSPCSSLSYSPPPILSDLEDDLPSDGVPPPSPPQSSPSSPTEEISNSSCHLTRLSPSVVSNVRGPDGGSPRLRQQESHTPLKDRPPDLVSSRTRRKSTGLTSPRLSRKRGADAAQVESSRSNGMVKCNGEVTTEPALLARLSGLSEQDDRFGSPRGKEPLREKMGLSPRSGHVNGLRRSQQDSFRVKETQQQQQQLQQEGHIHKENLNNNISDENDRCLPSSLSSLMASFPSSLSSSSFSTSSSSSSSGLGSSLSGESSSSSLTPTSSGTSTPTLSSSPSSKPAPKVRFPPPEKKDPGDVCRWRGCGAVLDQSSSLLEHIQAVHVEGQLEAESFRCLWVGCKVFDRASCSVSWLERHVLLHGGHKPFKCIVDGCGHRFRSQTALGRHVNHHFSSPASAPAPRPQSQSSPVKLLRKNGRKLRYRKRPWSDTQGKPNVSRVFDFFDLSTMEKVKWGLMCSLESQVDLDPSCNYVNFRSQVLCKRRNMNGDSEVLVRWSPNDILPDEWVKAEDLQAKCSVPFHKLNPEGQLVASRLFCPNFSRPHNNKRKRSPHKRTNALTLTNPHKV